MISRRPVAHRCRSHLAADRRSWPYNVAALTLGSTLAACAAVVMLNCALSLQSTPFCDSTSKPPGRFGARRAPMAFAPSRRPWRCSPPSRSFNLSNVGGWAPRRWDRSAPGRIPILLVHGYLCNRGLWWWLRRRLRARRHVVATINLEPPLAGVDRLAAQLGERIEALLAETGAEKVLLVTHSMGGLGVARLPSPARRRSCRWIGDARRAAPRHADRPARPWPQRARDGAEQRMASKLERRAAAADPDREPMEPR